METVAINKGSSAADRVFSRLEFVLEAAAKTQDSRPAFCNVHCMELFGKKALVATNSHILNYVYVNDDFEVLEFVPQVGEFYRLISKNTKTIILEKFTDDDLRFPNAESVFLSNEEKENATVLHDLNFDKKNSHEFSQSYARLARAGICVDIELAKKLTKAGMFDSAYINKKGSLAQLEHGAFADGKIITIYGSLVMGIRIPDESAEAPAETPVNTPEAVKIASVADAALEEAEAVKRVLEGSEPEETDYFQEKANIIKGLLVSESKFLEEYQKEAAIEELNCISTFSEYNRLYQNVVTLIDANRQKMASDAEIAEKMQDISTLEATPDDDSEYDSEFYYLNMAC
jgi:hypothetical protein